MEERASSRGRSARRVAMAAIVAFVAAAPSGVAVNAAENNQSKILDFDTMVGVAVPYTGSMNAIRGIAGGGLPWVIARGVGKLRVSGEIKVDVRGLVLDPNDPTVISRGLAGVNPSPVFKAIVSCMSTDEFGNPVIANRDTVTFPADAAGNSRIDDRVDLPEPCIAPIVFVTSGGGSWFAATGF